MHNSNESKQINNKTQLKKLGGLYGAVMPFSSSCTFRSTARSRSSSRCARRSLNAAQGTFRRNIWGAFQANSENIQGTLVGEGSGIN
jgi:hypothetical protein